MINLSTETGCATVLKKLSDDPNLNYSWKERVEIAKLIETKIEDNNIVDPYILSILDTLSNDARQEVKRIVASYLKYLPENVFSKLSSKLVRDDSRFVRIAAELSIKEKGKRTDLVNKQKTGLDSIKDFRDDIANQYDGKAAELAEGLANQLYDTLVGSTAHELKRVLSPIRECSERLAELTKKNDFDKKQFKKDLEVITRKSRIMHVLVQNMQNYTKTVSKNYTKTLLNDVLREARDSSVAYFKENKINIGNIDVDIDLTQKILVDMDRDFITLSFENLIKNAIESYEYDENLFSQDVNVKVTIRKSKDHVVLKFIDEGKGIPEDDLNNLKRFKPIASSKPFGTGFGLPTARKFILEHNGEFDIKSKFREGTTIIVKLPLEQN